MGNNPAMNTTIAILYKYLFKVSCIFCFVEKMAVNNINDSRNLSKLLNLDRRILRDTTNPLERSTYGVSKEIFRVLLDENNLVEGIRITKIPSYTRLAVVLNILAKGDFQNQCGSNLHTPTPKASVWKR